MTDNVSTIDVGTAYPVAGLTLGSAAAGLHPSARRDDLALLAWEADAAVSAMFTQNTCAAAPVIVARRHLNDLQPKRCCLVNAGFANAGTGEGGLQDCLQTCTWLAEHLGCSSSAVLPFSTGVIGERLPLTRLREALPGLISSLRPDGWAAAARAILTTDTKHKLCSTEYRTADDGRVRMTGMAKGAGMIRPHMATMLAFIATDADVDADFLDTSLRAAVERSFNRITIDGDCSTNDAVALIATGRGPRINRDDVQFAHVLEQLCRTLAAMIVADGEGATRVMEVRVEEGRDREESLCVAYRIAESPLVKTALHAADPNWGRILAAAGAAGANADRLFIAIGGVQVYPSCGADEAVLRARMSGARCRLTVRLGRGQAAATVLGCDLSGEYVRINAEYRS